MDIPLLMKSAPQIQSDGTYYIDATNAFEPANLSWTYDGQPSNTYFAAFVSGAQRLHNGNTLITLGPFKRYFEVDKNGNIVWDHTHGTLKPSANFLIYLSMSAMS